MQKIASSQKRSAKRRSRGNPNRVVSDQEVELIHALHEEPYFDRRLNRWVDGMGYKMIAKKLELAYSTVRRICNYADRA